MAKVSLVVMFEGTPDKALKLAQTLGREVEHRPGVVSTKTVLHPEPTRAVYVTPNLKRVATAILSVKAKGTNQLYGHSIWEECGGDVATSPLYQTIKQMVRHGWLIFVDRSQLEDKPQRKLLAITPEGEKALYALSCGERPS